MIRSDYCVAAIIAVLWITHLRFRMSATHRWDSAGGPPPFHPPPPPAALAGGGERTPTLVFSDPEDGARFVAGEIAALIRSRQAEGKQVKPCADSVREAAELAIGAAATGSTAAADAGRPVTFLIVTETRYSLTTSPVATDCVRHARAQAVLGLATGSSPTGVYAELVRMHRAGQLSLSNVITFNLDEYFPMKVRTRKCDRRLLPCITCSGGGLDGVGAGAGRLALD